MPNAGDRERRAPGNWRQRFSIESRDLRIQFTVGVALLFAIPLLATWYLLGSDPFLDVEAGHLWIGLYTLLIAALAACGAVLLVRAPNHLKRLRNRLEQVVDQDLTDGTARATDRLNDLEAVESCMRRIVEDLRYRIEATDAARDEVATDLVRTRKTEAMCTMATGIAHDFNNLMAAVLGNVSIVLRTMPPDSPARENALQIQASAAQAVDLSRKVALYAGRAEVNRTPVDVNALIEGVREQLAATLPRGVEIALRPDPALPGIPADREHVRELVQCLVENAAESIETRRGTVTVTTRARYCRASDLAEAHLKEQRPEGHYIEIEVADDGCGITSEVRARMFDPFYSTKIRGQGMGLPVVLGVTRAHEGAVLVDSRPDEGTVFRVLLPCKETRRAES